MAFGPIITIPDTTRTVILAPFERDDTLEFIKPGMQQASVTKYLSHRSAPVSADQFEWYDRVRTAKDNVIWGIWIEQNDERELIGVTELMHIAYGHTDQAVSGVQISKKEYWGKGIVSLAHKARTWYAFEQLGLDRIRSEVVQGNAASLKALQNVGYTYVYTERNDVFVDGALRHMDCLELLNPADLSWQKWWGSDTPTERALEARHRTREVLTWCNQHLVV